MNSFDGFSPITHSSQEFFPRQDVKFQKKMLMQSKNDLLKSSKSYEISKKIAQVSYVSNTNITDEDDDTQISVNSINSLMTKNFSSFYEQDDNDNKRVLSFSGSFDSQKKNGSFKSFQNNLSAIPNRAEQTQENKEHGEELQQNQSNDSVKYYEMNNDDKKINKISYAQNDTNSEISSLNNSSIKKVSFNDYIQKKTFEKDDCQKLDKQIQIFLTKWEEKSQQQQEITYSPNNTKQVKKTILKASKTWEQESIYYQDSQDGRGPKEVIIDYCQIMNEELIQKLLNNDVSSSNNKRTYFFSELVTKISRSGERQKRIIFLTNNSFFVLKNLNDLSGVQKFEIQDINKIVFHSHKKNTCSVIVRNMFQLNLKINHIEEFILIIQSIFRHVLRANTPLIYKEKKQHKDQANKDEESLIDQKAEQISSSFQTEFYVLIQKIDNESPQNNSQIQGLIQIFETSVCIASLEKCEGLNRLLQVDLIKSDLQNRCFLFKSQKNSGQLFAIKLLNDSEFTNFFEKIYNFYENKITFIK